MAGSILLNDNIPSHVTMRGVTRYFRKITAGLAAHFGPRLVIYSSEVRDYGAARYIHAPRFRGIRRFGIHDALASLAAARERPAVFYSPYFGTARTQAAQVFTVYDLALERQAQQTDRPSPTTRRYVAETRRCLERATLLMAISESTAREVTEFYPHLSRDKLVVTPLGVDDFFFARAGEADPPPGRPYLLYVGERGGHKNFVRLLHAFGQSDLAREFDLRVISRLTAWDASESEIIRRFQLASRVYLESPVSEVVLRKAYAHATALVYPSLIEGFGLPILEALASGTLVATSNTSAMPEVGGTVAFYFDPHEPESIAACLRRVVSLSPAEREAHLAQGMAHARTFTWARCQEQTVCAFERLLR